MMMMMTTPPPPTTTATTTTTTTTLRPGCDDMDSRTRGGEVVEEKEQEKKEIEIEGFRCCSEGGTMIQRTIYRYLRGSTATATKTTTTRTWCD